MADQGKRKPVVLVAYMATHFVELARVARLLRASGDFDPVMIFEQPYRGWHVHAESCRAEGTRCIGPGGEAVTAGDPHGAASRTPASTRGLISRLVGHLEGSFPLGPTVWLARTWRTIRRARRQLARERASLLVLAEDNVSYTSAHWIRAGHDLGLKSVIVPYTVANADEPAEAYWRSSRHQASGILSALWRKVRPRWFHERRGRLLQRLPLSEALALEIAGLAPSHPWLMNSGHADAVAVESDRMTKYYEDAGLPTHAFVATGAVADDDVARGLATGDAVRRELLAATGAPPEAALILLALMPDQLQIERTAFASYREMTEWVVATLVASAPASVVLVRPHPRDAGNDFKYLEQLGAHITRADTASLIGAADLYVAAASATIRWAVAAGRAVINYDVYGFGYTEYVGAPGVRTVSTKDAFGRAVEDWARARERGAARHARPNPEWGRLDGHSGNRLIRLMQTLAASATG